MILASKYGPEDGTDRAVDVVQLLVKSGADLNLRNNNGRTALFETLSYVWDDCDSYIEIITIILIEAGADVNIATNNGISPLLVSYGSISIMKRLVAAGTDGYTALNNLMTWITLSR